LESGFSEAVPINALRLSGIKHSAIWRRCGNNICWREHRHPKVYSDIDKIMEYYEQIATPKLKFRGHNNKIAVTDNI